MKIMVGTLRKLLREHGLSPAIFNTQAVQSALDKPNIAKSVQALDNAFRAGIHQNLVLSHADKYNKETREFDDAMFQKITQVADAASEKFTATIGNAVKDIWAEAHKAVQGDDSERDQAKRGTGKAPDQRSDRAASTGNA